MDLFVLLCFVQQLELRLANFQAEMSSAMRSSME